MFGAAIFFVVVAVIAFVVARLLKAGSGPRFARLGGAVFVILAVILFVSSCVVSVGTQDVGVITTFGHPSNDGILNGLHVKAPWQVIHLLDDAIQTDTYASNGYDGSTQQGADDGCINVRIARQATACVNVTIRWQIDKDGVGYLFRNYKNNDNIRDNLLHRDLQTAVNVAFADYDPLGLNANGDSTQPNTTVLAAQVKQSLIEQVGNYLTISNIFIPIFNFDPETQGRLNQLQLQVAQTRIAQQAIQTAQAQAAANRALRKAVSNDPGVLESKCLDILSEAVQKGQSLPAGFSCFPGGSQSSIAVK